MRCCWLETSLTLSLTLGAPDSCVVYIYVPEAIERRVVKLRRYSRMMETAADTQLHPRHRCSCPHAVFVLFVLFVDFRSYKYEAPCVLVSHHLMLSFVTPPRTDGSSSKWIWTPNSIWTFSRQALGLKIRWKKRIRFTSLQFEHGVLAVDLDAQGCVWSLLLSTLLSGDICIAATRQVNQEPWRFHKDTLVWDSNWKICSVKFEQTLLTRKFRAWLLSCLYGYGVWMQFKKKKRSCCETHDEEYCTMMDAI